MNSILNEPLNNVEIIRGKSKLKNELLPLAQRKIKLLILGGSTIGELKEFIYLFLLKNGIDSEIIEAPYNTYYEEVMFGRLIEETSPEYIYIHISSKNLKCWPSPTMDSSEVEACFDKEKYKFKKLLEKVESLGVNTIINNFDYSEERIFGNLDFVEKSGKVNYVNSLNSFISNEVQGKKYIYINDIMYLSSSLGLSRWHNNAYWHSFKYAMSPSVLPYIARSVSNILKSILGLSKKVLVCDLDNTLWGGVIGDDGVDGIKIGMGNPKSEAFYELQSFIKCLKDRGVILSVNSKNEMSLAESGFSHENSVLNVGDFSSFMANWSRKSCNIGEIEKELNLFKDSFVFIDDNKAEIKEVENACPQVVCLSYDKSPTELVYQICNEGYFEASRLSKEDIERTKLYSNNKKIMELKDNSSSFEDYLKSLSMTSKITNVNDSNFERVVQLINKTNQFNPTAFRLTSSELELLKKSESAILLVASLSDIYVNNGVVSCLIAKVNGEIVEDLSWVMSCRVFNRELEFAIFDKFIEDCRINNIKKIKAKFIRNNKNGYVEKLYDKLGFSLVSDEGGCKEYMLVVNEYEFKNNSIEVSYE